MQQVQQHRSRQQVGNTARCSALSLSKLLFWRWDRDVRGFIQATPSLVSLSHCRALARSNVQASSAMSSIMILKLS